MQTIDWSEYDLLVSRLALAVAGEPRNDVTMTAVLALAAFIALEAEVPADQAVEILRAAMAPDEGERGVA